MLIRALFITLSIISDIFQINLFKYSLWLLYIYIFIYTNTVHCVNHSYTVVYNERLTFMENPAPYSTAYKISTVQCTVISSITVIVYSVHILI